MTKIEKGLILMTLNVVAKGLRTALVGLDEVIVMLKESKP